MRESSATPGHHLNKPMASLGLNNISTMNILGGATPNDSMMMVTNTMRNNIAGNVNK